MAGTVTVACKVPNGLVLQLYTLVDSFEQVFGGGARPIKVSQKIGEPVKINGFAHALTGAPPPHEIIGGYGLTHNVDAEMFAKWMEDNKDLDLVKNGLIFAHAKADSVQGKAKEQKALKSNMEPLNTESRKADKSYADPRMPRNVRKINSDENADA